MAMAITSTLKTHCHSSLISKTSMAIAITSASSFCPQFPVQFKPKPTSQFFSKPPFSFFSKQFSSQPINASIKDEFSGRVGFLGLGIMGSPMAQNLLKAG
ncbi:Glyoxylate/succinic semialdehyde reductase 2 chloroplastic [Bienertia sinuspersici]